MINYYTTGGGWWGTSPPPYYYPYYPQPYYPQPYCPCQNRCPCCGRPLRYDWIPYITWGTGNHSSNISLDDVKPIQCECKVEDTP